MVPPEVLAQAALQAFQNNGIATNGPMSAVSHRPQVKPETKAQAKPLGAGAMMSLDLASNGSIDAQRNS